MSPTEVIRGLMDRGGLRAEILDSGVLREGDVIRADGVNSRSDSA
ncbi:hypothetical protein ASALC70_02624 [Alcanivorax sp. ALC70]|nr:hypothetical protein ASALC70_02624 [Alcanivorax sp. ALC70]